MAGKEKKAMRTEHPRPDFRRDSWVCLNGLWEFAEDPGCSGRERGMQAADAPDSLFDLKINVPFCRESELSGLGHRDFCDAVWYRKKLMISEGWLEDGKRLLLRIGACDWKTRIWVNGKPAGEHTGGYTDICCDITPFVEDGDNVITVMAEDRTRSGAQPSGKQSMQWASHGCFYTRTTGIWQSVWLESVPEDRITSFRIFPDTEGQTVSVVLAVSGPHSEGMTVRAEADYEGKSVGTAEARVSGGAAVVKIPLSELHLWEIGNGRLYGLKLTLSGGALPDTVRSYFGMRSVRVRDGFVYLNGKRIFQRLVLDQGFYPDGIYTAPSEQALIEDIERSQACGFEGARLHQKIFEPLFLYHCDRLGYIVWGEHGNWGADISGRDGWASFIPEWVECLRRDFNHPAIIGWCPLNETQRNQDPSFVRALAAVTRTFDPTRAYIDASGWTHVERLSDIPDNHDYEQDPKVFRARYEAQEKNGEPADTRHNPFPVTTRFVSEYGGIRWSVDGNGWGYGNAPATPDEFIGRFRGLTDALLDNRSVGGLCYTQLTDVEQEVNGLYTYGRRAKFDPAIFRAILSRRAVIETESDAEEE